MAKDAEVRKHKKSMLTARQVERLAAGPRITDTFDAHTRGLALRVYPSGHKAWLLFYRDAAGSLRRVTLSAFPDLDLADARVRAAEARQQLEAGIDPRDAKRERRRAAKETQANTVREWWKRYAEIEADRLRSWNDRQAQYDHDIDKAFGAVPIRAISRADVRVWLERKAKKTPVRANALFRTMHRFCAWLVERDALPMNPLAGLKRPTKESPRDRVLNARELGTLWRSLTAGPLDGVQVPDLLPQTRDALLLLLLTGARLGEVARMGWQDVDLADPLNSSWRIPASKAKNGQSRVVPIAAPARAILLRLFNQRADPQFVFAVPHPDAAPPTSAKRRTTDPYGRVSAAAGPLRQTLGADFRLHDFRRSIATHLVEHGTRPEVVAALLGHASVLRGSVTGRHYLRVDYTPQVRAALELWARMINQYAREADPPATVGGRGA